MPALNEAKTISAVVEGSKRFGRVIVIDDGSTDDTYVVASVSGAKVISHKRRMGYGAALDTGFKHMVADIFVTIDADLQQDPSEIGALLEPILRDDADFVIGSKFLGNLRYRPAIINYLVEVVCHSLLNVLYGVQITNVFSGFRAFRAEIVKRKVVGSEGMVFTLKLVLRAIDRGDKIVEVPRTALPRSHQRSRVGFRDGLEILYSLFTFILTHRPKRYRTVTGQRKELKGGYH